MNNCNFSQWKAQNLIITHTKNSKSIRGIRKISRDTYIQFFTNCLQEEILGTQNLPTEITENKNTQNLMRFIVPRLIAKFASLFDFIRKLQPKWLHTQTHFESLRRNGNETQAKTRVARIEKLCRI